ncbi:MAG TPA: biotin/lipoyl-binding protein [Planctomycetota bacterium]|nr:biotin/lipoyl-binding protein [Planctomycetota bacterium]
MWKWFILVLAVAGAAFGIIEARRSVAPQPLPPLLKEPVRNPFEKGIAGSGLVEPASENIAIGVSDPGMVTAIFVKQNQKVKKGDPLFEIDSRTLQSQLLTAQAAVRKSETAVSRAKATAVSVDADLKRVEAFRRKEDEPGLRAKVEQAQSAIVDAKKSVAEAESTAAQAPINIADAQNQLAIYESTERTGGTTREQTEHQRFMLNLEKAKQVTSQMAVETAKSRVKTSEAACLAAKSDLDTFLAGAWKPDVDKAQAALGEAKVAVDQADADLGASQAEVARIKLEIERHMLRAPIDGTILRVNLRVNEYAMAMSVNADSAPIVMGNIEPLHIRADIDEFDAQRFKPGMKAVATPKGATNVRIPLEFVRVDPFVIPKRALTNAQHEMVDTRVLEIIYKVLETKETLYVGQQVDVFIDATE